MRVAKDLACGSGYGEFLSLEMCNSGTRPSSFFSTDGEAGIGGLIDEDQLLKSALAGHRGDFAELMERHRARCARLAMSILKNHQDAEDEVQNAWWKAWEHLQEFRWESRFSSWLMRIVMNQCLMRRRQLRNWRAVTINIPNDTDGFVTFDPPDCGRNQECELGRAQVDLVLRLEVDRIPAILREVVRLRDLEELPLQAVADRLGITVGAAKSRLLRARLLIRKRMTKHCGRLGVATLMA